jgi:hypothetical protein
MFGFHANHSMTMQCMRLTEHAALNFNNKMSITVVLLDIEEMFDIVCNTG